MCIYSMADISTSKKKSDDGKYKEGTVKLSTFKGWVMVTHLVMYKMVIKSNTYGVKPVQNTRTKFRFKFTVKVK